MGGSRVLFVAGVLALGSCALTTTMDLSENPRLYRPTGYSVAVPADLSVFLAPVVDARRSRVEEATKGHTVQYFSDERWHRQPAKMVDAVLRDELADSGVFESVQPTARADSCVMQVRLLQFDVGAETHVTGWRSFATVGLAVNVLGPVDASGARPELLSQTFEDEHHSEVDWRPPQAAPLMGLSLRQAVQHMLAKLDQSNVGRANVPPPGQ